ncbi:MAG: DUF805 domain-containing protein [Lactobacillaceae bacterium]|nr:DUF805 domain-containing protein [Lactobacillaceae bacterium]
MISMWGAFKAYWKNYVNFTGKATRAEYWWMQLWGMIILVGWLIVAIALLIGTFATKHFSFASWTDFTNSFNNSNPGGPMLYAFIGWLIFGLLLALAMVIPSFSLSIRRYRDAGLKTWAVWVLWALGFLANGYISIKNGDAKLTVSTAITIIEFIVTLLPTANLAQVGWIGHGDTTKPNQPNNNRSLDEQSDQDEL